MSNKEHVKLEDNVQISTIPKVHLLYDYIDKLTWADIMKACTLLEQDNPGLEIVIIVPEQVKHMSVIQLRTIGLGIYVLLCTNWPNKQWDTNVELKYAKFDVPKHLSWPVLITSPDNITKGQVQDINKSALLYKYERPNV